jgi:hypothetical protein
MKKKNQPKLTKEEIDSLNDFIFPDGLDDIIPQEISKDEEIKRLEGIISMQQEQIQSLKEINNVLMGIKNKVDGL